MADKQHFSFDVAALEALAAVASGLVNTVKEGLLNEGTAGLESRWAHAMTAAWQAIPHAIRAALVERSDVLNPENTDTRLEEGVKQLVKQSLTSINFVREKNTGVLHLDMGSSYLECEMLHLRLVRRYAADLPAIPVLVFKLSEFNRMFVACNPNSEELK